MKKYFGIAVIGLMGIVVGCQKKYEVPPIEVLPVGSVITIDSLKTLYEGEPIKFEQDISVYGTVTMDETDGNIYKNVYVEDTTGAIEVRMPYGGGVYEGDYVRLALRDVILSKFAGKMQLDSCSSDRNIIKIEVGKSFPPLETTIADINALGTQLESRLVRLENVQFLTEQLNDLYADSEDKVEGVQTLSDCNGNTLTVESSGYANFADEQIAQGNGTIDLIITHTNGNIYGLIRKFDEISMNGERCDDGTYLAIYRKDFDDLSLTSGGWTTQVVTGGYDWEINSVGPRDFAQISNFNGTNTASESWLISPAYDFTGINQPIFQFDNAFNYSGAALEAYVSTDYDATGNVTTATWTKLSPTLSTGGWAWVNSGALDLSDYKSSSTVTVAFKYTGSDNDGSTWEVDNIIIRDGN